MLIVADHELFQCGRRQGCFGTAVSESLPSDGDGGIDVEQDEEGSTG